VFWSLCVPVNYNSDFTWSQIKRNKRRYYDWKSRIRRVFRKPEANWGVYKPALVTLACQQREQSVCDVASVGRRGEKVYVNSKRFWVRLNCYSMREECIMMDILNYGCLKYLKLRNDEDKTTQMAQFRNSSAANALKKRSYRDSDTRYWSLNEDCVYIRRRGHCDHAWPGDGGASQEFITRICWTYLT
jgi:hypothetical protein